MRLWVCLLLALACGRKGGFRLDATTVGGDFGNTVIDASIVHGQGIEVVDIDGDLDLDCVVAFSLTDGVYIYRNEGSGRSFTTVRVADQSIVGMEVEVADLDGDRDLDIAAVGLFNRALGFAAPGEVTWFENPGDIRDRWERHDITGLSFPSPVYIEAADLTGNGSIDLVVGSLQGQAGGNGVYWFRNNGTGTFDGPIPVDADLQNVRTVQIADVDGDLVADIVAAGRASNEIVWYENRRGAMGDETPAFEKHLIAMATEPADVQVTNMDDDMQPEVVATLTRGNGAVVYYDPPMDETMPWTEVLVTDAFGGGEQARTVVADFDGDNRNDVTVTSLMQAEMRVYLRTDDGWEERIAGTGITGLNFVAGGDIDGNRSFDLVTSTYANTDSSDFISWWSNSL